MAKIGKVIDLGNFVHEGTCVEYGSILLSFNALTVGFWAGT